MEDPRTISASLDLLFLAKAIERIGDHAKNIAEFIIYIVKGADVYLCYPDGQGRSRLKLGAKALGTARNMNTVAKLAELAEELA